MPVVDLQRLHLKVGTKAQYNTNKASLDASNTLALTPLASEFTSNTTAGKGQFGVAGVTITTLAGTVGNNTANAEKPVYLNNGTITALSNSSGANTANALKPVYLNSGAITPLSNSSGANTANAIVPVYVNAGAISPITVSSGGTAQPVYVNAGKISPLTATVGQVGNTTTASKAVYLNAGTLTVCANAIPVDQVVSASTYYPIYMANDTTAGSIEKINMAAQAIYSFNPSTHKWKYTTTNGAALDFGIERVATW